MFSDIRELARAILTFKTDKCEYISGVHPTRHSHGESFEVGKKIVISSQ